MPIAFFYVPRTGFEPARPLRAPPPQSGLSTSFNTWAFTVHFFSYTGVQISRFNTLFPKIFFYLLLSGQYYSKSSAFTRFGCFYK